MSRLQELKHSPQKLQYFQSTMHVHKQWLAYTWRSTKNVNDLNADLSGPICSGSKDQWKSLNINSPAAAVTPHRDELKSISPFKARQ